MPHGRLPLIVAHLAKIVVLVVREVATVPSVSDLDSRIQLHVVIVIVEAVLTIVRDDLSAVNEERTSARANLANKWYRFW